MNLDVQRALHQQIRSLQHSGVQQLSRVAITQAEPSNDSRRELPDTESVRPRDRVDTTILEGDSSVATRDRGETSSVQTPTATWQEAKLRTKSDRSTALDQLCQQVAGCEQCPELASHRTQTVFGVGNVRARLCFFGEGPGADEDRQGEPFVGRAGQLLNKIIEACTLKREDVYILNTVKCRPPGNRNPEAEEIDNCRHFFEKQFEIIQPEYIVCLGLVAARSILHVPKSLGSMRGRLHPWRGAQVLVTYHPAYLLRNPPAKKDTWADMQFLMSEMGIDLPNK